MIFPAFGIQIVLFLAREQLHAPFKHERVPGLLGPDIKPDSPLIGAQLIFADLVLYLRQILDDLYVLDGEDLTLQQSFRMQSAVLAVAFGRFHGFVNDEQRGFIGPPETWRRARLDGVWLVHAPPEILDRLRQRRE